MNTKKTCEYKLTLTMNALALRNVTSADLKSNSQFYETFAVLAHEFFTNVVTSNSNWSLIRLMDEDTSSLADDCTMKFLSKLDYFLALSDDRRIKTAVVMANNLIRDKARSHQCHTKHVVTPDEYEWSLIPDTCNVEKSCISRESTGEIIHHIVEHCDPMSAAAFLGITVLRIKPAELSKMLSSGHTNLTVRQILNDVFKMLDLSIKCSANDFTDISQTADFSPERLSDLCYETKRKLRKQFR